MLETTHRFVCVAAILALFCVCPCWSQGFTINTIAGGGSDYACNGEPPLQLLLSGPTLGLAIDGSGNLFVANESADQICEIAGGVVNLVAGASQGYSGDGGPAISASLNNPFAVAVDTKGNVYIADTNNNVVRVVNSAGIITTFAGNGKANYSGDGGPATKAELDFPDGVAVDASGNVYIADYLNHVIRKVTNGIISTFAGNGDTFYNPSQGNNVAATSVGIAAPTGIALDAAGNLYIATYQGWYVFKVTPGGIISVVAGNGGSVDSGDGGPATQAGLAGPFGVAVDSPGNVFITEAFSNVVREVNAATGIINTIAGNGMSGFSGDGGPALNAEISSSDGIAIGGGKIYLGEGDTEHIRVLSSGQTAPGPPPVVTAVVNGASFVGGGVVPGEMATAFGTNLTTSTGINVTSGLPLPSTFLSDSLLVNNQPVALFAVDNVSGQQQINFQVPWTVASGPKATFAVAINGTAGASISVPVLTAQPGIFNYKVGGNTFGAILHSNFELANSASPAKPGETVLIYCTGLGAVSSPPADGAAGNGQPTLITPTVMIGGTNATVSFSGLAPGFVGLYQVNAKVPSGLSAGNQTVGVEIVGTSSNSVLLPVQ
jgi:uncharacterized protein (TIGR03437 family)